MVDIINKENCVWTDEQIERFIEETKFSIHNNRLEGIDTEDGFLEQALAIFLDSKSYDEYSERAHYAMRLKH